MEISNIKIRKISNEEKLKAIVSVTFDNELVVHDIKVIEGADKLFVAMPSRKNQTGEYKDIVHPINAKMREYLHEQIISSYLQEIERLKNQDPLQDNIT
jgi:stage V sporulation protein G